MKMMYQEERSVTNKYKDEYRESILRLAKKRQQEQESEHMEFISQIMDNPEKYRADIKELLGYPLNCEKENNVPNVKSVKLSDEGEYSIYRMQIEVLEEHWITGLLFKYNDDKKRPFSIVQHGALGTPELISGIYGSTTNYNDMLCRVLKKGINVFAPQLLLWSETEYDNIKTDRNKLDARLKRTGSSMVAVEAYSIMRILDYFEAQDYTDKIGMVGLSYGGFFTQVVSALDTRIDAAISCSFFGRGEEEYDLLDLYRKDDSKRFSHAELACLTYPRKLFLEMGNSDELFDCKDSVNEFEKIKSICKNDCSEWLELKIFDGNHEFYKGDEHIDKFAQYLWSEN